MNDQTGFFIWLAMATVFLLFGATALYARFKGQKTSAIITNVEMYGVGRNLRHQTYVTYDYNGQTYDNVKFNFWSSGYYPGKVINVYMFDNKPDIPKSGSLLFLILGIIFIVYIRGELN